MVIFFSCALFHAPASCVSSEHSFFATSICGPGKSKRRKGKPKKRAIANTDHWEGRSNTHTQTHTKTQQIGQHRPRKKNHSPLSASIVRMDAELSFLGLPATNRCSVMVVWLGSWFGLIWESELVLRITPWWFMPGRFVYC